MQSPLSSEGPSDSNPFPMAQKLEAKGGNGGKEWDDGADHEGVSKIYIREGSEGIESIKFDYVKNGEPETGPIHGGLGQDFTDSKSKGRRLRDQAETAGRSHGSGT
ncbi:hypothetical protein F2Q70_00042793 [Brassica cretica]|uniref:Jacalin-type lectin domain-containing protein n=1 Tax=Brassica cretica TaxID=69181 RepID=A0A8S9KGS3_BRACR|nr:hypothetical protein F2Q70_00042793 [Brassica cretica]